MIDAELRHRPSARARRPVLRRQVVDDCPASGAIGNVGPPATEAPLGVCRAFIADILKPYRPAARYLRSAAIESWDGRHGAPLIEATGRFAIEESCYIDDTGHFNAVEFNICYNQLAYVAFGKCIARGLVPQLGFLSFQQFKRDQLPSWLIVGINNVRFSRQMCRSDFSAVFTLDRVTGRGATRFFQTSVSFWDAHGLKCRGTVMLAHTRS